MVLVKNWPFFHLFILGNIHPENLRYTILERKNGFLSKSKKSTNDIFPKGLLPGFGKKLAIFPSFNLGNIHQENLLQYSRR